MVLEVTSRAIEGVPTVLEYAGRYRTGSYAQVFERSFGMIVEGICPTCSNELRASTGYCWDCSTNWSACEEPRDSGGTRKVIQLLDGADFVLTWTLAPGIVDSIRWRHQG